MAAETPESYRTLDASVPEIRLFVLEPSQTPNSPLVGHLKTVSLASPPPYEGLSYMWGKPNLTESITITGKTLLVTPNLEVALRSLRLQNAQRVLWIDAICINQQSLMERAQQVALMGRIYARCDRDLLWLGPLSEIETRSWSPSEEKMGRGFNLLKRLADRDNATLKLMAETWSLKNNDDDDDDDDNSDAAEIIDSENEEEDQGGGEAGTDEDELEEGEKMNETRESGSNTKQRSRNRMLLPEDQRDLESAFRYPEVWRRLWVMQELSLAPKVQLVAGSHTLDWDVISSFLGDTPYADAFHGTFSHGIVGSIPYFIFEMVQIIDHQRRIMREVEQGGESKLIDVLARYRRTHCLDPRDKIYGLLGLVTDLTDIAVDYSRSPAQVYVDVTLSLINHARNLDMICQSPWHPMQDFRWTKDQTVEDLPSWAADFLIPGEIRLFAQRSIFNAGRPFCEVPCRVVDQTILCAKGVVLGHVGPILQDDYPRDGDSRHVQDRYRTLKHLPLDWMRMYLGHGSLLDKESGERYITGESIFTAFWRTLVVDSAVWPMVRLTSQRTKDEDTFLRESWLQYLEHPTPEQLKTRHSSRKYFHDAEIERMWVNIYGSWSFTKTDNGLFALVMPPTREGDIIACLDGAKVPVILRPMSHNSLENVFRVITITYVHGFMDTEATESAELRKKLGLHDQEFWLA